MEETIQLSDPSGITVVLTEFGARVLAFLVPISGSGLHSSPRNKQAMTGLPRGGVPENSKPVNITLHLPIADSLSGYYERQDPYFGCIVGRVANRIARGRFELGGRIYTLPKNNGEHCLHGGLRGLSYVTWTLTECTESSAQFEYVSPDGEEGFPGEVLFVVRYSLREGVLYCEMRGEPTLETPISMTNHMYFNLNGAGSGSVLEHTLQVAADYYLPVDATLIPTGELRAVAGTAFDFRAGKAIGRDLREVPQGYDHTFVLHNPDDSDAEDDSVAVPALRPVCSLYSPGTGLQLSIAATHPGLQVYSGNMLDGTLGNEVGDYQKHGGIALEPHHFPNAVNEPRFPSVLCTPAKPYYQSISYTVTQI